MTKKNYLEVEDLEVYKKLCQLHIMAKLKGYISEEIFAEFRIRYKECIRMLNGLEKTLERKIPKREQRWQIAEEPTMFSSNAKMLLQGWPEIGG